MIKSISPHWTTRMYEYGVSFFVAIVFFIFLSIYIYNRRGFYDLYIINKVFAGVAALQLGTVLLLGPLTRMFTIFDRFLKFRKELGIVTFIMASLHVVSSLFFLGDHFPFTSYLTTGRLAFLFGLIGIALLFFIFSISNKKSMVIIGIKRWWEFQYWSVRVAFVVIALHVFVMKFPGWIDWYKKGGDSKLVHPEWPGLGLFIGWYILFVFLIRIFEAIHPTLGKWASYIGITLLALIYVSTFVWGSQFAR